MMTWISIAVCLGLFVKLTFFTDLDRRNSRLFYRLVLFATAVYTAYQIVYGLYGLDQPSPWRVAMHLAMFVGAFFLKAHHLPWNHHDDRTSEAPFQPVDPARCVLCGFLRTRCDGQQCSGQGREPGASAGARAGGRLPGPGHRPR